jgi:hypothetical protein
MLDFKLEQLLSFCSDSCQEQLEVISGVVGVSLPTSCLKLPGLVPPHARETTAFHEFPPSGFRPPLPNILSLLAFYLLPLRLTR